MSRDLYGLVALIVLFAALFAIDLLLLGVPFE